MPSLTGLGAFLGGEGPFGHDPEDELVTLPKQSPIEALKFDPYTRAYLQNTDYTMIEGSGVIQRAAHLMLPLGSIASVANSGLDVESIRRASPEARLRVIEDALNRTWKVLLEAEVISIGKVTITNPSSPWDGQFEVEVRDLVHKLPATLEGKV